MPLRISLVTGAGAIVLYIVQQSGVRRSAALRDRATAAVLLLLLWAALSIPAALNPATAVFFFIGKFFKLVLLYLLIASAVRGFKDVDRLAFVYYASAAVYAAVILTRFSLGSGEWRLGGLYYYDANDFATLAVTAIPLGLYFSVRRGPPAQRVTSALGLALLSVTFVRSGSRGGFLAMLAVTLFVLVGYRTVRTKWRVAGIAAIAAVLLATASDRYWTQMQSIFSSERDYNQTSQSGRIQIWQRGMGYMLEHPVLGVGLNNFPVAEGTISAMALEHPDQAGVRWDQAHNTFVQVGAELGIPGLLFLVTMLGGAYGALRRVARQRPAPQTGVRGPSQLADALTASLVGFIVGGFFLSLAYHEMLYTLVALAAGLGKVTLRTSGVGHQFLRQRGRDP
jgi:O-antigen ligase